MDKSRTSGEWERMVSGQLYTPVDPKITKRHRVGMRRCDRFNRLPLWCTKTKQRALERLIHSAEGKNFEAFAPFYCEYGVNIYVGRNCFINYNSVFLDVAPITPETYQNLICLRMETIGKVTGVFDLDFDKREFSAVHIMDGWTTWAMRDVIPSMNSGGG